jgi:molybdenum cofactor guanylyltransferase
MKLYDDIPAFILAGGSSTRMGQDKALLNLDGKPLIEWVAVTVNKLFSNITIVSDQKEPYAFLNLPVQPDILKDSGPLAGIHAALVRSPARHIFVIACDLPFVTSKLIERIIDKRFEADVVLPADKITTQPLCAVYSRAAFQHVVLHLRERQFSVLRCIQDMKSLTVTTNKNGSKAGFSILANVATPDEYEKIQSYKD